MPAEPAVLPRRVYLEIGSVLTHPRFHLFRLDPVSVERA